MTFLCVTILARSLGEAVVRSLFLPRSGAGEKEVRSSGVEHSLRVQRVRSQDQHEAATGIALL